MMKNAIKYQLLFTVFSVFACFYSGAQEVNTQRNNAKRGAEKMAQLFSLSATQTKKLDSLFVQYGSRLAVIAQSDKNEKEKSDQRMALYNEKEQALKQLMTDEQYKKYVKLKEDHMEAVKKRNKAPKKAN
jgi:hypothetical protein